jgi:UDP-N-acetylglucosamine acyltransferase
MSIHPTAVVHGKAELDSTVEVGPHAVIDAHVTIGANCRIGPHVYLTGHLVIGEGNQFHAGCVMGDAPQDLKYTGEPTRLRIGDRNVFREHVTVHRSNSARHETVIGSGNFLMAGSHVGHNAKLGNGVIMANGSLLAGHVEVHDNAVLSGNCLVHQFVRVGRLALMQGGSAISKDLPPFTIARGQNHICGLNVIGLRRAGASAAERLELRRLYRLMFRSGLKLRDALHQARQTNAGPLSMVLLEFIEQSQRSVCADVGRGAETEI